MEIPSVSSTKTYHLIEIKLIILVLAQYLFRINGHIPTNWELKGVAIAGYTLAVLRKSAILIISWNGLVIFVSSGFFSY